MRSRVMPGSLVTMERRVPVKRLKSADLPTLGRPTITRDGSPAVMNSLCGAIFQCTASMRPPHCKRGSWAEAQLYKKYELEAGVGLAAEELAGAGAADEFAGIDDGAAARENGCGRALDLDALEHGIVHAHVMRFGADDFFLMGVEEDKVGVGADGDGAFARVEAEKFCWRGGDKLNKTIRRKMLAMDAAGVDQAEAMLMPGPPLGIFVKSSLPSSFCSLKQNGQWSVETTCSVSFARPCQSFS